MNDQWVIYILVDPRTNEDRYVGYTINIKRRLRQHLREAKHGKIRTHKNNWLNNLLRVGLEPTFRIVETGFGRSWIEAEKSWILCLRSQGAKLTNTTEGGEGPRRGTREKMAAAMKGRTFSEEAKAKLRAAHKGKRLSTETRAKLSESIRTRWADPVYRERMTKVRTGLKQSDECIAKRVAKNTGKKRSVETKEMMSASLKKAWSNPEVRARHLAGFVQVVREVSEETRAEISIRARISLADPAVREKMSASAKLAWADPEKRAKIIASRSSPEIRAKQSAAIRAAFARKKLATEEAKSQSASDSVRDAIKPKEAVATLPTNAFAIAENQTERSQ